MPGVCSIYGCDNIYRKGTSDSFYSFPKSEEMATLWVEKCRKDYVNTKFARICSRHFSESQFARSLKYELLNLPPPARLRLLREDAVPDLNLPPRACEPANLSSKSSKPKRATTHCIQDMLATDTDSLKFAALNRDDKYNKMNSACSNELPQMESILYAPGEFEKDVITWKNEKEFVEVDNELCQGIYTKTVHLKDNSVLKSKKNSVFVKKGLEERDPLQCNSCAAHRKQLQYYKEMIVLKELELHQVAKTVRDKRLKLPRILKANIERRISNHKLYIEAQHRLHEEATNQSKWVAVCVAEIQKKKQLQERCRVLKQLVKTQRKKSKVLTSDTGRVDIEVNTYRNLNKIKNQHQKVCAKVYGEISELEKQNALTIESIQEKESALEAEYNKRRENFIKIMHKYRNAETDFLDKSKSIIRAQSLYVDAGSKEQIIRDAELFLNRSQMAFLEGQLLSDGIDFELYPSKYKSLLLSLYNKSRITLSTLRALNFNIPPNIILKRQLEMEQANVRFCDGLGFNRCSEEETMSETTLNEIVCDMDDLVHGCENTSEMCEFDEEAIVCLSGDEFETFEDCGRISLARVNEDCFEKEIEINLDDL